jgi:hypothetical protein
MTITKIKSYYHHSSSNLSRILGSPTPWIFLFGATGLGLLSEGISKLIDIIFPGNEIISGWATAILGLILIIFIIVAFDLPKLVSRFFSQSNRVETTVTVEEVVPKKIALIALVSRGNDPSASMAMQHHFRDEKSGSGDKRYCWLITGPDTDSLSSQANAKKLAEEYQAVGVQVQIWPIENADNPGEVFNAVQDIYQSAVLIHKLTPDDIIADFTGGTKCMTAGMVLAFADKDLLLQYMKPNKYDDFGRAVREAGSTPHLVDVNFLAAGNIQK